MSSPAEDVRTYLATALAPPVTTPPTVDPWGYYASREPETPDLALTVYDTGGMDPNAKWSIDHPTVQVRVRGAVDGYAAAWTKALAVKTALLGIAPGTITGYQGCWQRGDIFSGGYDDLNRPWITLNFEFLRTPSAAGNRAATS